MTDLSRAENEDLLTVHPDDLAVEVDEDPEYDPHEQSNVVVVEPPIISIGRSKRVKELYPLRQKPSDN